MDPRDVKRWGQLLLVNDLKGKVRERERGQRWHLSLILMDVVPKFTGIGSIRGGKDVGRIVVWILGLIDALAVV